MRAFRIICCFLLFCFLFSACSSDATNEPMTDGDDEPTADGDEEVERSEGNEVSENNGENEEMEEALPPSGILLRRLNEGEVGIGGPNAVARAGDFLMENEHVRFVIQDDGPARSWVPYGGSLVDADIVRESGGGHDLLGELTPITAYIRAFKPEESEVIADGSDGETAHLQVRGVDAGIPIIDSALPLPGHNLQVTLDYELALDANYLKVTTTITAARNRYEANLGDGVIWGNRVRVLTPGFGWGLDGLAAHGAFDLQLAVSNDGEDAGEGPVYGLFGEAGELSVLTDMADILPYMGKKASLNRGEKVSYTRYFVVGQDVSEVYQTYAALRGKDLGALTITLDVADPLDEDALFDIELLDADGLAASYARAGEGETTFHLSPGAYTPVIGGLGRLPTEADALVEVNIGDESEAALTAKATGRVEFQISGDHFDGTIRDAIPSKLTIQRGHDAPKTAAVLRRVYTASGTGVFLLEPGEYTITASRGYEYELCKSNITLEAGRTEAIDCYLERVVDTTGWVAGDMHIHTERSIDAIVRVEDRVIQCAAEGIERTPITDHDTVTDLDPLVEPLGLRDYIKITAGDEVSPLGAHTNGYPMDIRDDLPAYYGVDWSLGYSDDGRMLGTKTMPEIWDFMREEYNAGIIQINHPRGSQGYFSYIDYDPLLGVDALEPGVFDLNWDAVELINSGGIARSLEEVIPDWFSLLNQGIERAGVAVSDTHTYANPGQARTYMRAGVDDPNEISDALLVETIQAMRVQAVSGPFVTFHIGDAEIGDITAGNEQGEIALSVKVQAPSWIPVDWVRIYQNGEEVLEITELSDGVVRLDENYSFPADSDSWFVVMAGAPESTLAPEGPGQPVLTVANPIFVDIEGDGYEAVGLPEPQQAKEAFDNLKALGRMYNPIHHSHDELSSSHSHSRCDHISGLGDHIHSGNRENDMAWIYKLKDTMMHQLQIEDHHHHPHRHNHHDHHHHHEDLHRYGYGTDAAAKGVFSGCARPDLIPTTVLK